MLSASRIVPPLRVLLVVAALFSLVMLVLSVPGSFADDLARHPRAAHLLWPVLIATEGGILAFLVVIGCTWQLLGAVQRDRIFHEESMRWVDVLVRVFVTGWLVLVALAAYLTTVIYLTPELRDPGTPLLLFGMVVIGAVLVMIVAVLRALLKRATALQADLDEVI